MWDLRRALEVARHMLTLLSCDYKGAALLHPPCWSNKEFAAKVGVWAGISALYKIGFA